MRSVIAKPCIVSALDEDPQHQQIERALQLVLLVVSHRCLYEWDDTPGAADRQAISV